MEKLEVIKNSFISKVLDCLLKPLCEELRDKVHD